MSKQTQPRAVADPFHSPQSPTARYVDFLNNDLSLLKYLSRSGHKEIISLSTGTTFPGLRDAPNNISFLSY